MRFEIILRNPWLVIVWRLALCPLPRSSSVFPFDCDVAEVHLPSLLSHNLKSKIRKSWGLTSKMSSLPMEASQTSEPSDPTPVWRCMEMGHSVAIAWKVTRRGCVSITWTADVPWICWVTFWRPIFQPLYEIFFLGKPSSSSFSLFSSFPNIYLQTPAQSLYLIHIQKQIKALGQGSGWSHKPNCALLHGADSLEQRKAVPQPYDILQAALLHSNTPLLKLFPGANIVIKKHWSFIYEFTSHFHSVNDMNKKLWGQKRWVYFKKIQHSQIRIFLPTLWI